MAFRPKTSIDSIIAYNTAENQKFQEANKQLVSRVENTCATVMAIIDYANACINTTRSLPTFEDKRFYFDMDSRRSAYNDATITDITGFVFDPFPTILNEYFDEAHGLNDTYKAARIVFEKGTNEMNRETGLHVYIINDYDAYGLKEIKTKNSGKDNEYCSVNKYCAANLSTLSCDSICGQSFNNNSFKSLISTSSKSFPTEIITLFLDNFDAFVEDFTEKIDAWVSTEIK